MATVQIGGHDLEVRRALTGWVRKQLEPALDRLQEDMDAAMKLETARAKAYAAHDALTRYLLLYLAPSNENLTAEWLSDNLPPPGNEGDAQETIRLVRRLAGFRDAPPGEAKSP